MPTTAYSPKRLIRVPALTDAADIEAGLALTAADIDDMALAFSGTLGARPGATSSAGHTAGCPGTEYFATDTGQLFKSSGGTWREVPIGTSPPSGTLLADLQGPSTAWKDLDLWENSVSNSIGTGTDLQFTRTPAGTPTVFGFGTGGANYTRYIDPADYTFAGRVMKVRVRATVRASQAPGSAMTFKIAPIVWDPGHPTSGVGGSMGTALTSVTISSPAADTTVSSASAEATLSTATNYLAIANFGAGMAVNTFIDIWFQLQYRIV